MGQLFTQMELLEKLSDKIKHILPKFLTNPNKQKNHVAISYFCYVPKFASLHVFLFGVWNNRVEYQVRNQQSDYVLALAFTNMLNSGHTSLSCERQLSRIDPYLKSDTMALWRAIKCFEFCEFCYLMILKGYAPN